jgi:hypothetical protein
MFICLLARNDDGTKAYLKLDDTLTALCNVGIASW